MSKAVMFIAYKLVEGASAPDFLAATARVNAEIMSKQKGFVDWKQLREGETWADMLVWETMEDAVAASQAGEGDPASEAFCAFLDMGSVRHEMFAVEQDFGG